MKSKTGTKKLKSLLKKYFKKTETYSVKRLILEFFAVDLVLRFLFPVVIFIFIILLALLIILPVSLVFPEFNFQNLLDQIVQKLEAQELELTLPVIIGALVAAPIVETLLGQVLPISIASRFTKNKLKLILISAVVFSVSHINLSQTVSTIPTAILLAWSYLVQKEKSKIKAYLATAAIHFLSNSVGISTQLIFSFFSLT